MEMLCVPQNEIYQELHCLKLITMVDGSYGQMLKLAHSVAPTL